MLVDPEDAQVRVAVIIGVNENHIRSIPGNGTKRVRRKNCRGQHNEAHRDRLHKG